MPTSIYNLKGHYESQLDLLLRLAQANHSCLERVVSTQLSAIQGVINQTAITDAPTVETSVIWLAENRKRLIGYWEVCLRDSFDYQHKMLAELASK